MNKFLAFVFTFCLTPSLVTAGRVTDTTKRPVIASSVKSNQPTPSAKDTNTNRSGNNVRSATTSNTTIKRDTTNRVSQSKSNRNTTNTSRVSNRIAGTSQIKKQSPAPRVMARATAIDQTSSTMSETRTGAEYEKCKSAFFTCMDQFCQLKSDDYRRCACSDRMKSLSEVRSTLQEAGNQLTVFTENLDVIGLTKNQATAMKTASEGENALTSDKSASKALLQAIMNSLRGEDSNVSGKYSDLNSINLSFDAVNSFGTMDAGQAIAKYSGQNLYSAVYPQCRQAVKADCNNASMQRAINAYLMAIEQDCNTVQSAIENMQKQAKASIRESSAMLDLARVENRQNHNSDDVATCINNVESAILSEEVCGKNYHKCLDNGQFIDISTGAPIAGIENFYELENMLTFSSNVDLASQKLSKLSDNRTFVLNFESHVKKFAKDALDKCREKSDEVWADYLDKALLDIYYSQKSKVSEIKQGCFDFISACQENGTNAMTAAMASLTGDARIVLQPDSIELTTTMCENYITSCDKMFAGDTETTQLFKDYIAHQVSTDTLAACRAVIQQCFDNFGGTNYENFYTLSGGVITEQQALDWFTLYDHSTDTNTNPNCMDSYSYCEPSDRNISGRNIVSKCAAQAQKIDACGNRDILIKAFGGFDKYTGNPNSKDYELVSPTDKTKNGAIYWGTLKKSTQTSLSFPVNRQTPRPIGVASEVYYKIIDILTTQCRNLDGVFSELLWIDPTYQTPYSSPKIGIAGPCFIANSASDWYYGSLRYKYSISDAENMCPKGYSSTIDTKSWGACLCWENGARRSNNGTFAKCTAMIPYTSTQIQEDPSLNGQDSGHIINQYKDQVCPSDATIDKSRTCTVGNTTYDSLPEGQTKK